MSTPSFKADLHCHTNFSDGTDSPEELIQLAIDQGLSGLAITDHDTTASYERAHTYAQNHHFRLLPGVEFSSSYGKEPIHVLGYSFSIRNGGILQLCQRHQDRRKKRNRAILQNLCRMNILIDEEELYQLDQNYGTIGRPHIASLLIKKGVVKTMEEAFDKLLGEGKPAYDAGEPITLEETIQTIHNANGLAILAHPHLIKRQSVVRSISPLPFDGLEGYYARFPLDQTKRWTEMATKKNWLITGGSDYHGQTKPNNLLGSSWVEKELFESLFERAQKNNR